MLLAALLREHYDELEADLLEVYRIDLDDLHTGDIHLFKVARLVEQLPLGSRVWSAMGLDTGWTNQEHLLANIFDVLGLANWQRAGDKNAKKPTPVPRPAAIKAEAEKVERLKKMSEDRRAEAVALEAQRRYLEKQQT